MQEADLNERRSHISRSKLASYATVEEECVRDGAALLHEAGATPLDMPGGPSGAAIIGTSSGGSSKKKGKKKKKKGSKKGAAGGAAGAGGGAVAVGVGGRRTADTFVVTSSICTGMARFLAASARCFCFARRFLLPFRLSFEFFRRPMAPRDVTRRRCPRRSSSFQVGGRAPSPSLWLTAPLMEHSTGTTSVQWSQSMHQVVSSAL